MGFGVELEIPTLHGRRRLGKGTGWHRQDPLRAGFYASAFAAQPGCVDEPSGGGRRCGGQLAAAFGGSGSGSVAGAWSSTACVTLTPNWARTPIPRHQVTVSLHCHQTRAADP